MWVEGCGVLGCSGQLLPAQNMDTRRHVNRCEGSSGLGLEYYVCGLGALKVAACAVD